MRVRVALSASLLQSLQRFPPTRVSDASNRRGGRTRRIHFGYGAIPRDPGNLRKLAASHPTSRGEGADRSAMWRGVDKKRRIREHSRRIARRRRIYASSDAYLCIPPHRAQTYPLLRYRFSVGFYRSARETIIKKRIFASAPNGFIRKEKSTCRIRIGTSR